MTLLRRRIASSTGKVLVIAAFWTLVSLLSYTDSYLLIGDLVTLGKLSGSYPFWPDFAGNLVIGAIGGLVGGPILVFKVNAGYKHRTFLSGIVRSGLMFVLIYLCGAAVVLFALAFVYNALRSSLLTAAVSAWHNVARNLYTPSFLTAMLIWGMLNRGAGGAVLARWASVLQRLT